MASRWQSMGTSVHRRSLQHQEQLKDSKELQPVVSHQETSVGALGSLCRQFQRRLPLRAVNLNLRAGPSWKRLETPEPENPGVLPKWHQVAGGDPGEGQEAEERSTEGQWIPNSQPEPEEHPAVWSHPCPLSRRPLGEGASPPLCPDGLTCPPITAIKAGGCLPEPLLLNRAPLPRRVDHPRSGVGDQSGQHGETSSLLKIQNWLGVVVHACNPSSLGG
uniref:PICALM interacting mitotic regulator n=1 Tax=Pan troglodytes TaxID=9598 RepID=A0A2I3TKB7_PANTR